MHRLVLGCMSIVAAGCVVATNNPELCGNGIVESGEACDDGNILDGDGCSASCQLETATLTAIWTFKNLADGMTTGCPAGFSIANLVTQQIDAMAKPIGDPVIAPFPCSVLSGVSGPLNFGTYQASIQITNGESGASEVVYATSLVSTVTVSSSVATLPTATILNDGGYFHATWTLHGVASNTTLTCAQANMPGSIVIQATLGGVAGEDMLRCTDGQGFTSGYLAGTTYMIVMDAETNNQPLGAVTTLSNQTIATQNQVTELGDVTIQIDGL